MLRLDGYDEGTRLRGFAGLRAYYGDLHNHCHISYGHGSLDEALLNAQEQLDFCSVTGHALWPDMPEPTSVNERIVDFHREGFARLRRCWPAVQERLERGYRPGQFVTFLSFEMHSCADGDYTVLYGDAEGQILDVDGLSDLQRTLRSLREQGVRVMAFPHHIAYRRGQRGINWDRFDPRCSPLVEVVSMHGCSEADEGPRPYLHTMGPSDHESTVQYGLATGRFFGFVGSTDHHSAHPGSYGHGRTGVWAAEGTREALWEALEARRTYALTGDSIALQFCVNGAPMGTRIDPASRRELAFRVRGGAPIDCVDVIKNGQVWRRISRPDVRAAAAGRPRPVGDTIRTLLVLEVGWGPRGAAVEWEAGLSVSAGRVLAVEPRFRGPEVVTPLDTGEGGGGSGPGSHWELDGSRSVRFLTTTYGNPNNRTPATQAICLHVEAPLDATVEAEMNGQRQRVSLQDLTEGARAYRLGPIGTASCRLHRAPAPWEVEWAGTLCDEVLAPLGQASAGPDGSDTYYLRVRQMNDQWAWCSPVRVDDRG